MHPPLVNPEWIVVQLDRALKAAGKAEVMLAFDADGTLWSGDVGIDLYEALLEASGVRDAARDALAVEAKSIGLTGEGDANAISTELYAAYNAYKWPLERAFATMAWSFAGWPDAEVVAFAARVVERRGLASRARRELDPVRVWARERGVEMFVVSASPIAIVRFGAEMLGFARDKVIAMAPAVDAAGVMQPRLAGRVIYGEGKVEAIVGARPEATILGAFGDSGYDAAMLKRAKVPVAVAPGSGLTAMLGEIPGVAMLPCADAGARSPSTFPKQSH